MSQTINIDAGDREYVDPPLLVTADHDISSDTVSVGLGTWSVAPTTWLASSDPAALVTHPTTSSVQATLLIGGTVRPAAGVYWLYVRIVDQSETLIERSPYRRIVVTNTGSVTYT
jgi:hypothetical protein